MKAIVWEGKPFHIAVKDVPVPKVEDPNDVLVRITTTAICGTDLHIYRGLEGSRYPPWIVGHEGVGTIVQAGQGVKTLRAGDRVVAQIISCGYCDNCLRDRESYCLTYSPSTTFDSPGFGDDFGAGLGGTQGAHGPRLALL
jgi:glutathione-independent formaldehyde dehydrogenase